MIDQPNLSELPHGWVWTKYCDICDLINGMAFKPTDWANEGLPIIRIQNLNNANAEFNRCNFKVEEKFIVNDGQLLFAWSGTPGTSFGAHIWDRGKAVLNQHIFKVMIDEKELSKRFLMYLINRNISEYVRQAHGSAGLAHITKGKFEDSFIAIPPLPEQNRIVAKIEALFIGLDEGTKALKKIQLQLKRYRQSVLKAAFEGKLTTTWREAHKAELESASVLLEFIKEERKKKLGRKYIELPPVDIADLHEIPEGWAWVRLESIADIKGGITVDIKRKVPNSRKVPYLRVANVQRGYLDLTEIKEIEADENTISQLLLKQGDILFNEGGDRDKLGRGWIWQNQLPECIHQNHVFRARLYSDMVQGRLVSWFGNTFGQQYFSQEGKQTTNLASVNLTKLSAFPVPIPSKEEQREMVTRIEYYFSIADDVEKVVEQSLKQADRLRQSALKSAFEGKLVSQDPNDEPAEKLLKRIKSEKVNLFPHKKVQNQ